MREIPDVDALHRYSSLGTDDICAALRNNPRFAVTDGVVPRFAGYTWCQKSDLAEKRRQTLAIEYPASRLSAHDIRWFGDVGGTSHSAYGRLGLRESIRAARRREFDMMLVLHFDCISTTLANLADIYEILQPLRIPIYAIQGGLLDCEGLRSCPSEEAGGRPHEPRWQPVRDSSRLKTSVCGEHLLEREEIRGLKA